MSAIEELLSLPADSIESVPDIQAGDVASVTEQLESILRKCLYCVRQRLSRPLDVLMAILARVASLSKERLLTGLQRSAGDGMCLDLLCELVAQMLAPVNAAFRLTVDANGFLTTLATLCAQPTFKAKCGAVVGALLLGFMRDAAQHADDYRVSRQCAGALIALVRGSRENKDRFSARCAEIAACLDQAFDFFFQMQCVELLFRLYTHARDALESPRVSDYVRRGVKALPEDSTLLLAIQNFLDGYNADLAAPRIRQFTVLRMEVSGTEFCGHTTVYFSPVLLVVLLPGNEGRNLTIPHEHIRSVKLSKGHKLALRLSSVPAALGTLIDLDAGRDTLHLFFTQSTLNELRGCDVYQWIADRKQSAPLQPPPPPPPVARSRPASQPPPPAQAPAQQPVPIAERPANASRESVVGAKPDALAEIHNAAAARAARYREEQLAELQGAADGVQEVLAQAARLNARDRDAFEAQFREDMTVVRRAEATLKESAAACVQELNTELEEMQVLGALLRAEAEKLRQRLAETAERAAAAEEQSLVRIKQLVDGSMEQMEGELDRLASAGNPLYGLVEYIGERTNPAPSAQRLRLEGS